MYELAWIAWESPVFVIGYDLDALARRREFYLSIERALAYRQLRERVEQLIEKAHSELDPWLFQICHQSSGTGCEKVFLLGCVLPWNANVSTTADSADVLEKTVDQQHSKIHTSGWNYEPDLLQELEGMIAPNFKTPSLFEGTEACLKFQPGVMPSNYCCGWKVMSLSPKPEFLDESLVSRFQGPANLITVGPDTIAKYQTRHDLVYDAVMEQRLLSIGEELGGTKEEILNVLRLFLLWENCD